jgi:NADH-quinone oxidoreductase subunit F
MMDPDIYKAASEGWNELHSGTRPLIMVGSATCGMSAGALEILESVRQVVRSRNIDCNIRETACIGLCYAEPLLYIAAPGGPLVLYGNVSSKKVPGLIRNHLEKNQPSGENILGSLGGNKFKEIPDLFETPVFKPQVRKVLGNCGIIDPGDMDHYLANKGYRGLIRAMGLNPIEIIDEISLSGLRGRGGAGFPVWKKWRFCRDAAGETKYLVCNADEGDPGAFMNRSLLEGDPHALIEGMIIAGYAIGASHGYIYCRAEYPLALKRLRTAIEQAEKYGFLGHNIINSGFDFEIRIKEGAGAFVCGEETALLASIEGKRGVPRPRPPFPAISGLWDRPTVINNVETLACVAKIMQNGASWFNDSGTEKSRGTKSFSLVGNVMRSGLIEVPLGITLREIIYDIGGGISGGKKFKAVQTGGPSGGCVPAEMLDLNVDYESLARAGTIMGSGGLVVMDEDSCMVDVARYFLDFAQRESCGKCSPCRLGTKQMLEILEDITHGRGKAGDIDLLCRIGEAVKKGSLCGLGQTAPNPVLTTIRYFREEYESHIFDHKCRSGVCRELIHYRIIEDDCTGCHSCARNCPVDTIQGAPREVHKIIQHECIKCGVCVDSCPERFNAVRCIPGKPEKQEAEQV